MLVFYFTGTGNSLAVAKKIGGELISIPQAIKDNRKIYKDEEIGLVFPLYCLNPPKMVREFLRDTKFETKYLFAIATYGNLPGAAMEELQKRVKNYGYQFDYLNTLLMVDNFLPNFEVNEEIEKLPQKKTEECLKQILKDIKEHKQYIPEITEQDKYFSNICEPLMENQDKGEGAKKFIVSEKCNHCGICAKVCPAGNIKTLEKTTFANKCESCYACIHACPQNAIHLKDEKSSARWRNPEVSLEEIIESNQQI